MTAYLESNGLMLPRSLNGHGDRDVLAYALTIDLLESRLASLESRLQEDGWMRLGSEAGREFSRDRLGDLIDLARINYLKNPLIRRAVNVIALYVWGQDVEIAAPDDGVKAVIDRFWRANRATFTGQQASRLLEVEIQTTGNVFFALFVNRQDGGVTVRTVPVEEMHEIVTNPDDRHEPWFYLRKWKQRRADGSGDDEMAVLYPDWRHAPADKPASARSADREIPIRWDVPVCHVKQGAFLHWRWGVPPVYAALDWAKAYKEQLEDDATRSRALTKWAYRISTSGGAAGVAAAKARLGTTLGVSSTETNPPPTAGSAFIGDKSIGFDPIRLAGAVLDPDHTRPARHMVASATGLPDTILSGDVDQGNLATAKTLDRPTELMMAEERQMWKDVIADILQFVVDADINAAGGILRATPSEEAREITVSWPDLLERDARERVGAVVDAATLSGRELAGTMPRETVARQLMVALGTEDIDGELVKLALEWDEQDARREQLAQQLAQKPQQPPDGEDEEREAFVAALKDVREAARALAG